MYILLALLREINALIHIKGFYMHFKIFYISIKMNLT